MKQGKKFILVVEDQSDSSQVFFSSREAAHQWCQDWQVLHDCDVGEFNNYFSLYERELHD